MAIYCIFKLIHSEFHLSLKFHESLYNTKMFMGVFETNMIFHEGLFYFSLLNMKWV